MYVSLNDNIQRVGGVGAVFLMPEGRRTATKKMFKTVFFLLAGWMGWRLYHKEVVDGVRNLFNQQRE